MLFLLEHAQPPVRRPAQRTLLSTSTYRMATMDQKFLETKCYRARDEDRTGVRPPPEESPSGRTVFTLAAAEQWLDLGLLGDLQRVIHLYAEVPDGALQLGVAKQQLNGSQVLRAFVDQGRFRSPHRVRPIGR